MPSKRAIVKFAVGIVLLVGCSADGPVYPADGAEQAIATVSVPAEDALAPVRGATADPAASSDTWMRVGADIDGEAAEDLSGQAVALSADGSRLAVGAPRNGGNGESSGHVRVFGWDGTGWVQVGGDIDGEAAGDGSGMAVALSADGSRLAVGAPRNGGNGESSGHVRVFDWDGTGWVQVGVDIDGEAAGDASGWTVALSADGARVAIEAPLNDGNGESSGHVRVFDWDGTGWVQVGGDIDGEAAGDGSTFSAGPMALSADGARIAIGASNNGATGDGSGHVRVFDWDGTSWVQIGVDIDGEAGDGSGWTVAVSADGARVAIGAPASDGISSIREFSGVVRVFDWDGFQWVQVGPTIGSEIRQGFAGWSAALSADGSRVAIGTRGGDGELVREFAGQARVFDWDGVQWVQVGADIDGEASGDWSGGSVALSADGSRIAVGAIGNDGNDQFSGHVRVLDQPE